MSNETISSTVSPDASDVEQILFGYSGVGGSFLKYYKIEIVIYVITIITNAITVTLISCYRRLRILSNLFFACLATTDLFQGFFGVAFNALRILLYSSDGGHSYVKFEGLLFLLVGWWLSTLFSYCSILLISFERWFFIAYPFVHQRFYTTKNVILVVALASGLCVLGCVLVTIGNARSSNVGISFPALHTIFSISIVATYAHIILISYRQQKAIRSLAVATTKLTGPYCDRNYREQNLTDNALNSKPRKAVSKTVKTEPTKISLKEENKILSVSTIGSTNHTNSAEADATMAAAFKPTNSITRTSLSDLSATELAVSGDETVRIPTITKSNKNIDAKSAGKRKSVFSFLRNKKEKDKDKGVVAHNWKAVRMSATVFCMYFCFMSPWVYYEFITALISGPRTNASETSQALNTLTCLHFCSNFFVYSFQNRDFRRELSKSCVKIFGGCCPRLRNKVTDITNVTMG